SEESVPTFEHVEESGAVAVAELAAVDRGVAVRHQVEDGGQRLGGIQVVVKGVLKGFSGRLRASLKSSAFARRKLFHGQPVTEVPQPLERLLRLVQAVEGKIERLAKRDLAQQISDRGRLVVPGDDQVAQGEEIARRF